MKDIVEVGTSDWGTSVIGETKVVSPFTSTVRAGRGNNHGSGTPADVGHYIAFGNTEEHLHRTILGLRRRGRVQDGPFDHATGHGYVAAEHGDYYDAIHVKNNLVVPYIVETFGGIGRCGQAKLRACAKVAAGCGKHRGRDGSRYGRYHRLPYSALHIARISVAAVQSNARCMLDEARIRMLGPIGPPPGLAA